jgi:hypothetical protein
MGEPTLGERMAKAEAWIEGHEELCAERFKGILQAVSDLKDTVTAQKRGINKAVWLGATMVISLLGWMGAQLVTTYQRDIHQLQQPPAAIYASPAT